MERIPDRVLSLVREDDTDCPVCGLGNAFAVAQQYDTCARCGWVDDPAGIADPERRSETNDDSLIGSQRSWPARLALLLAEGPRASFGIATRDDAIGGYDYLIDGVPLREMFPSGDWDLKSSIGPWPAPGDWAAPLRSGAAATPTGRTRLYVCHLCGGDEYEPAVTADVHVGAAGVIWARIGLETYVEPPPGWDLDLRRGPAGFAFDGDEYRRAFAALP